MTIKNLLPNISQRSTVWDPLPRIYQGLSGVHPHFEVTRATFQGPASAVYSINILACFDSLLISDHFRNKKQQQKQQQQQNTNR